MFPRMMMFTMFATIFLIRAGPCSLSIMVNPYGSLKVVLNRHQLTTHAFLLDPTMWRTCVLRPFSRTLLSKTGDSDKHFVVGELGLKHMNQSASGMLTGLS